MISILLEGRRFWIITEPYEMTYIENLAKAPKQGRCYGAYSSSDAKFFDKHKKCRDALFFPAPI